MHQAHLTVSAADSIVFTFIAALYALSCKTQVAHFNILEEWQIILWHFGEVLQKFIPLAMIPNRMDVIEW